MKIKVEYNNTITKEIHTFNTKSTQIQELYTLIKNSFEVLPKQFKLLYLDEEGDQITVSTDHDLLNIQEINQNSQIKLTIEETVVNVENNDSSIFDEIVIETDPKEDTKMVNEEKQQKEAPTQQKQEQNNQPFQHPFQQIAQSFFQNLGKTCNKNKSSNDNTMDFGFAKNLFKNICGGKKCGPFGNKKWGDFGGKCGPFGGKCGGFKKGGFMEHKKEFVRSVVREELEKIFPDQSSSNQCNNKPNQQVHHQFTCDGCGVHPIVGARFHCPECSNFDFCEKCEDSVPHPHSFLKIRKDQFEEEVKDDQHENPSELNNFFQNLIGSVTQIPEVQQLIVDPLNSLKYQGKAARIAELIGGKPEEYIELVKKHDHLDCKEIANLIQLEKGIQVSQQLEGLKIEEENGKQMNIQQQEPVEIKKKLKQFDNEIYVKAQQLSEILGESVETYLGIVEFFRDLKVCQIAEIILDDMSILDKITSYQ